MNDVKNIDPIDLIERAWKRIASADAWCQGSTAYRPDGLAVTATNKDACCWCADGALLVECGKATRWDPTLPDAYHQARDVLDLAAGKAVGLKWLSLVKVNDLADTDHARINTIFERGLAIAKVKWGQGDLEQTKK